MDADSTPEGNLTDYLAEKNVAQLEREFNCAAPCVRVVANPACQLSLTGFLKKSVRHSVHKQAALSYAVAAVDRAKLDILKRESFLPVVAVVLNLNLYRDNYKLAL